MSEVNTTPAGLSMDIDISAPTPHSSTTPAAAGSNNAAPAQAGSDNTAPGQVWLKNVPAEFENKAWVAALAQHENPSAEMFKQFDNQLSLIGRKAEGVRVPGENATAEDWASFNKSIGVPEKAEGYTYTPPTVPDELKAYHSTDEGLVGAIKEACVKAGVRPEGFKVITETFDKYYVDELQKAVTANKQALDGLENSFRTKFGDRSSQVLKGWEQSLASLSGSEAELMAGLDPRVKAVLAGHWANFTSKYVREDSLGLGTPTVGAGFTKEEYGDKYEAAFARVRAAKPGTAEYSEASAELKNLRAKAEAIFKS